MRRAEPTLGLLAFPAGKGVSQGWLRSDTAGILFEHL